MATAYAPEPEDELPDGMSESELAAHLSEHEMRAVGYFESEIASEQAEALERYYRRPYGDEQVGRSQFVDGTVAITVDNAIAALLKPFVSSDEVVSFEPEGPEDEEQAKQATDYINYVFHCDNPGFLILHDWFKDAALQKLGVVKAYWEDQSRKKKTRLENLDPAQAQMLQDSGEATEIYGPDENGLYVADVVEDYSDGKLCVENVPPEEFRLSPYARNGRTPPYCAHIANKPRSELIEMGFDPEVVASLSKAEYIMDQRAQARYSDETWNSLDSQPPGDSSRELVKVNDEYALLDFDGDGVSELRHVIRCDNVILFNEEVDDIPFSWLCPVPMPHKIYGQSLADQVIPEARISTVLTRQTLDNIYLSNNPRPILGEGAERSDGSTADDLMDNSPGAVIRAKDASQLVPFAIPFVADKSFPMLEYVANQAEQRTGIMKHGQGMDPDALDKQGQISATQAAIMEDGRNSRAELIARIFAETGVKSLFQRMLRLVVAHQPRARMIRLRNEWVEMDPRAWNAEMDMSISVGLGMGNKAQQMVSAQTVLATMEAIAASPFGDMVSRENVFNAVKRLYNAAGIKNVDDFITEPQKDENGNVINPPTPPDPKVMEAQAKLQLETMKAETKGQLDAQNQQLQAQQMFAKMQIEQTKVEHKAQLDQASAQFEAQLAEQKFAFEARMAMLEHKLHEEAAARDAERRDRESEQKVKQNRPGGKLDE